MGDNDRERVARVLAGTASREERRQSRLGDGHCGASELCIREREIGECVCWCADCIDARAEVRAEIP